MKFHLFNIELNHHSKFLNITFYTEKKAQITEHLHSITG